MSETDEQLKLNGVMCGLSSDSDLNITYKDKNGKDKAINAHTIMEFIDAMESKMLFNFNGSTGDGREEYSSIHAEFFNNKLNVKDFDTMNELLEHCKSIVK